ncbi:MAG: electron transport complex subunit RsxB [Nitrosomonas sp.]|nr:electron transport complex subunit RsxB [Nitrosomonas sp.]
MDEQLVKDIDAILPQTQCRQCGYDGCEPYAKAIVAGDADINQCPPGDTEGIQRLADLLGIQPKPLNTTHGLPKPKAVAFIDENICIGCTFCIKACPVDAIVGATKQMHTVISAECTGCELCVAPCPMDCIQMEIISTQVVQSQSYKREKADLARARYQFRLERLEREKREKQERLAQRAAAKIKVAHKIISPEEKKQAIVQAAIKRAAAARAKAAESSNPK